MPIQYVCLGCREEMVLPDHKAGQLCACPRCRLKFLAPPATAGRPFAPRPAAPPQPGAAPARQVRLVPPPTSSPPPASHDEASSEDAAVPGLFGMGASAMPRGGLFGQGDVQVGALFGGAAPADEDVADDDIADADADTDDELEPTPASLPRSTPPAAPYPAAPHPGGRAPVAGVPGAPGHTTPPGFRPGAAPPPPGYGYPAPGYPGGPAGYPHPHPQHPQHPHQHPQHPQHPHQHQHQHPQHPQHGYPPPGGYGAPPPGYPPGYPVYPGYPAGYPAYGAPGVYPGYPGYAPPHGTPAGGVSLGAPHGGVSPGGGLPMAPGHPAPAPTPDAGDPQSPDLISMDDLYSRKAPAPPAPATGGGGRGCRLVCLDGLPDGTEFHLPAGKIYDIGRDKEADVKILSTSVSRRQARIDATGGQPVLIDCGSANGTQVNGEVVARHPLREGDLIKMGKVLFRFQSA